MTKDKVPAEERRKQILRSARTVFARQGYAGALTRDIAAECGLNEAVMYKYFKSKESLFLEVMNEIHDIAASVARTRLTPGMKGLEIVRAMINSLWNDFATEKEFISNLLHSLDMSITEETHRQVIFSRWSSHHENLAKAIEIGKLDGSVKPDVDSIRYASMILALGFAYCIFKAANMSDAFKTPDPMSVFDMILDCLDASKPSHI